MEELLLRTNCPPNHAIYVKKAGSYSGGQFSAYGFARFFWLEDD